MQKALQVLIVIFIFSFMGCKYEDGPWISFRSAENRLKGEYVIDKFEVGGQDLKDSLKKILCFEKLIIHKNNTFKLSTSAPGCGTYGNWVLSSGNKRLVLQFLGPEILLEPLGSNYNVSWEIERLSDDEVHLTANYNNKFVKLNLKE